MAFDEVRLQRVVKLFGRTRALAGVDATLPAGAVTVIEGPNGSGKSTLLHCLALLAKPTSGTIAYGPWRARKDAMKIRRRLGVLTHASMLYPDLSGRENLTFYADLHDAEPGRVDDLCERFGAQSFAKRPVRTYSRGQLQRIALARALIAKPSLLLLDEPSNGLDRAGVDRLVEVVHEERDRGTIVVLITHDPTLAERVADRTIRLRRGRVVTEEGE
ncbi:MAG: heme ABC exporter ATP-binding protein CcmA [Myxococcota bacterium]